MATVFFRIVTAFAAALPALALAQALTLPNSFSNGQPADADEVNANFDAIEAAVNDNAAALASLLQGGSSRVVFGAAPVAVDCTNDTTAFDRAFVDSAPLDPVNLVLKGTCVVGAGFLDVVGRQILLTVKEGASATLVAQGVNLTSGMFWSDGVFFDSPDDLLRFGSFGAGYMRLDGRRDSQGNLIETDVFLDSARFSLFRGTDLRLLNVSSSIVLLRAENGSTATLNNFSGDVAEVSLSLNSSLWCRFCYNDFTGPIRATVNSAFLADATDPSWAITGSFEIDFGSVVRIQGSSPTQAVTVSPDSIYADDPPPP